MVRFVTGLTGSVDTWFSIISVVCINGIAITGGFVVVGNRVCLTTYIVTILILLMPALILIVSVWSFS